MLTQRLGSETQKNPEFIDSLIDSILKNPGSCDEVWLATDYGFPSLDVHRESARILADVAKKFRKIGVRVSLQLSNSIGHGEYMRVRDCSGLVYDGSPVEHMVGHNGTVASYCFCFNGKNFREYLLEEIAIYASAVKPYCLWVDDDLRANNHNPVHYGCFCDDCIAEFNRINSTSFDRESLVNEISFGDIEIRKKHISFLRDSIGSLTYDIGRVLVENSPDSLIGLQYAHHGSYCGSGSAHIFDAMYHSTRKAPLSRPGGGAYDDYNMDGFIHKASGIDYVNALLPDYVEDKRPEIENLPDVVYGKSIGGTCFETTYYLASGNTAMSYAMLMNDYEKMEWHSQMLSSFALHREYWERLCEVSKISKQSGLFVNLPYSAHLQNSNAKIGYDRADFRCADPLRYCNIPIAIEKGESDLQIIDGYSIDQSTDEEILELLNKNIIADATAVEKLTQRGFDCGVRVGKIPSSELVEQFYDHPINKGMVGRTWGGRLGIEEEYEAQPTNDKFEVIGKYITVNGKHLDGEHYTALVSTTQCGAKWAVFAFDFLTRKKSTEKRDQFLNACEYLTGHRFAGELVTPIQAIVLPRVDMNGKTVSVNVTNCTIADSGELELIIRSPKSDNFIFMSQYGKPVQINGTRYGDEYRVTIPNIRPWSVGTVFCD